MAYRFGAARLRDYVQASLSPETTALPFDGVGDLKAAPVTPTLLITTDTIPGDTTTTQTVTVGGPAIVSSIDTPGDMDFFKVELVAGQSYDIGMYLKLLGPSGVPLADAYIELYDAAGNLIVSADGGGPNTPSGLDALLTYTADYTGTYYINARSFDQVPEDGPNGELVGDYELFVKTAEAGGYRPYYTPDSPLYSIDWGSQVDGSSRNPDGDQGPRDNGEPFTGVGSNPYGITGKTVITYYLAKAGDVFIDDDPTTPGTTETMVAKGWSDWEDQALTVALDQFEKVADIVYVEVNTRAEADMIFVTYLGTPGPGVSLLGRMSPPDEENEGQAEFNAFDERWNEAGLARGGFTFVTLIHELGHGHGLAHPHDNGGRSGVMDGVESDGVAFDYTNGDYALNQGVWTMMSYEDGWQTSPYGQAETTDGFGWLGGLMAFDIAVIQDKYGVNEDTATGANVYALKDVNAAGTFYECIWDAGGVDEIRYTGARDANIDLRPASLQYEYGGAGWVSYATGIHGGFTIANGVTIENASGGSGDDILIGNDAANTLRGNLGDDDITGGLGADRMIGGDGDDVLRDLDGGDDQMLGGVGDDTLILTRGVGVGGTVRLDGGDGDDRFVLDARSGLATAYGGDGIDRFEVKAAATVSTGLGSDLVLLDAAMAAGAVLTVVDFKAGTGGDRLDMTAFLTARLTGWNGSSNPFLTSHVRVLKNGSETWLQIDADGGGDSWTTVVVLRNVVATQLTAANLGWQPTATTTINGTTGPDALNGGSGADTLNGGNGNDTLKGNGGTDNVNGQAGADTLFGGTEADRVDGGDGDDLAYGGTGADQMLGGAGLDRLYGDDGDDVIDGGADADKIYGGLGRDQLTGGAGADLFVFQALSDSTVAAADRILDFDAAVDRIDLRPIDADTATAGNQAFHFVGAFTHAAGEAVLVYDEDDDVTTLTVDVNGDGVADLALLIDGEVTSGGGAWLL